MSQDNVEAFKRAVDALNSGDVEAVLKAVHPAVEFHAFMEELLGGEGRVYSGHAGVREFFRDFTNISTASLGVRGHPRPRRPRPRDRHLSRARPWEATGLTNTVRTYSDAQLARQQLNRFERRGADALGRGGRARRRASG